MGGGQKYQECLKCVKSRELPILLLHSRNFEGWIKSITSSQMVRMSLNTRLKGHIGRGEKGGHKYQELSKI